MTDKTTHRHRPRTVVITNIIAPYRVPLFNELSAQMDGELVVLFCARTKRERTWTIPTDIRFAHRVLPRIELVRPGRSMYQRTIYVNPTLFTTLVRLRPDVVVSAEFSLPTLTALAYARLAGISFSSWSENTLLQEKRATDLQKGIRRFVIGRAATCVASSLATQEMYRSYGFPNSRIFVAPNTADVRGIAARVDAVRMRQSPTRERESAVVYVGSLSVRKGVEHLAIAFAQIPPHGDPLRLVLVGQGPQEPELHNLVGELGLTEQVEFAGFLEGDALIERLIQAAVFVLPSLEDTFGIVVNEAMACGLPVICSAFAGARELVHEGINGFVVDPTDHTLLADRIQTIIDDDELRQAMGVASRRIIADYAIDRVATQFRRAIEAAAIFQQTGA